MTTSHHAPRHTTQHVPVTVSSDRHGGPRSMDSSDRLARTMGWAGVGLGLAQLFMPRLVTGPLGIEGRENWVRACGVRQLLTGFGALTDNPTPAIQLRAVGDALDLAALSWVRRDPHANQRNVNLAMLAVGAATAMDVYCAKKMRTRHEYMGGVTPDYSRRSGFPEPVSQMRGIAKDFETPADMRAALPMPRYQPGEPRIS